MFTRTLLTAFCAVIAALAQPPGGPGGGASISSTKLSPNYSNLAYAGTTDAYQTLDLYLPSSGSGTYPVVLFFHAGGFVMGSKDAPPPYPDRLNPRGVAFASVNYRYSTEAVWPAQIQDARAAVRFLRANAAKYNLDADHIGVVGESAGSVLANLVGTAGSSTIWDSAGMSNPNVSAKVQAVVSQFGASDFSQMDSLQLPSCSAGNTDTSNSWPSQLLGCTVGSSSCAAKVKESVALTYVSSGMPAFFVAHGTSDCIIPPEQSRLLVQALAAAGNAPVYRALPGAGHGTSEFSNAYYLALLDDFLVRSLKSTSIAVVDSAEYQYAVASPGQFVTVFSSGLSSTSASAAGSNPWPTNLNGASLQLVDSSGATTNPGMVYAGTSQVNAQIGSSVSTGEGTITLLNNGKTVLTDKIEIVSYAPTLFSQLSSGLLHPLGAVYYTDLSGVAQQEALPGAVLDFSKTSGTITVAVYGTGLNSNTGTALAYVADTAATVKYAGAQGTYTGLDQYNVEIPRSLAGRGEVTLAISIGGMPATAVRLTIK